MDKRRSTEDYLESILIITEKQGYCRSIDVVHRLDFSKPSISVAMKKLEQQGLISRDENGLISLTVQGRAIAEKTFEKHRFLTSMFEELGVSAEVAEKDACAIEHNISDETFTKIMQWYKKSR